MSKPTASPTAHSSQLPTSRLRRWRGASKTARRDQAGFSLMDLTMAIGCVLFLSTVGIFAFNEITSTVQTDIFETSAYSPASAVSLEKESARSSCATQGSTSQADCGRF